MIATMSHFDLQVLDVAQDHGQGFGDLNKAVRTYDKAFHMQLTDGGDGSAAIGVPKLALKPVQPRKLSIMRLLASILRGGRHKPPTWP
jgi:hypothetical protein